MKLTAEQSALLPTEEDIVFYEEHGWWVSPPLLSEDEIEDARFGLERYYNGERDAVLLVELGTDWNPSLGDVLRQNDYVSLQVEELMRLARQPLIAATAARLARTPEVRLFHDQLIYKPPGTEPADANVGWHTDIAYWKTCSSRNLVTAWIPFQTVTGDMGPMTVLDGSHRWEGNDRLEFFHEPDLTAIEQRIARGVGVGGDGDGDGDGLQPVPLELKLGQVSFHHCRTIHGSQRNTSDRPRIALAVHMQDQANHYVRSLDAHGKPQAHLNDMLCRRDAAGDPDYADPEVCPVLWHEGEA